MMNTFIQTQQHTCRSLLLYGNLNDVIIAPDLVLRSMDTYLTRLLKEQGYEHVVFFGSDSNKGAYCLDPVSARYFFGEGHPLPSPVEEEEQHEAAPTASAPAAEAPAAPRMSIRDRMNARRGYHPGSTPGEAPASADGNASAEATVPAAQPAASEPQRYGQRRWELAEFFRTYRAKAAQNGSRIAVVFYDLFSTPLGQLPDLVDYINRAIDHTEHLFLLMAPSTSTSTASLVRLLTSYSLSDRFTVAQGNEMRLNPDNTHRLDMPGKDELELLLQRLSLMGTPGGRKVRVSSVNRRGVAEEIYRCCRLNERIRANQGLKPILSTLCQAIDAEEGSAPVVVDKAFIRRVWHVTGEEQTPEETFARPGWETIQQAMQPVILRARMETTAAPRTTPNGLAVERVACHRFQDTRSSRPAVPSFILVGSRGVGRSTAAQRIGHFLHQLGYLPSGHTVVATRDRLTSSYVNGTPRETRARYQEAEDGVLLIPDADTLADRDGGANHEPGGVQVMNTLASCMQAYGSASVVLTASPEGLEGMRRLNSAFLKGFTVIRIPDFSPELLTDVLVENLRSRGCDVDEQLTTVLPEGMTPIGCMVRRIYRERNRATFANAAEMAGIAASAAAQAQAANPSHPVVSMKHFLPQGMTAEWFAPDDTDRDFSHALEDFRRRFVGMDEICDRLLGMYRLMQETLANGGNPEDIDLPSFILSGNPGAGKTAVSSLLASMYFSLRMLGSRTPITVNASAMASAYAGGAQERMLEAVRDAQDNRAMLCVDEAHQLADHGAQGALRALMAPMTDRSRPFMCVLNCYPHRLQELLNVDSGAKRRFEVIQLRDYTGDELYEIFLRMKDKRVRLTEDADDTLRRLCEYLYLTRTAESGNAGQMERLLADMEIRRASRSHSAGLDMEDARRWTYTDEDFPVELISQLPPRDENPEDVLQDILRELDESYEGLDEIKDELRRLTDQVIDARHRGLPVINLPFRPIIFVGNPGVGKTLIANLLSRLLHRLHLVASPEPAFYTAGSLLGSHQNETKTLTGDAIRAARDAGHLMVLDECADAADPHNSTCREFVGCFLAPITDSQRPFRVIFTIYPENLDDFLALNRGMSSRLKVIQLPDYTGEQLHRILTKRIAARGMTITEDASRILKVHCSNLYRLRTNRTGNARQVETLLEHMDSLRLARLRTAGVADPTSDVYRRYVESDIPQEVRRGISINSAAAEIERLSAIRRRLEQDTVGYESVKQIVFDHIDMMIYSLRYPALRRTAEPGHYAFLGNPGTGKTTGAELLARCMHEIGLLPHGNLMKISATELMAEYEGQSGHNVRRKLEAARGHVLLIDEAYALASVGNGSFKQDVINTLVNYLDDEQLRLSTCIVFAGYEDDMRRLYSVNDGLRSRVTEVLFRDYGENELMDILRSHIRRQGCTLAPETDALLQGHVRRFRQCEGFSNGRTMRDLSSLLAQQVVARALHAAYAPEDPLITTVLPGDVPSLQALCAGLNLTPRHSM